MDLQTVLNEEQRASAMHLGSHMRIIAGAGSGKTRVLTYRIAYLIENIGVDPRRILAITFTNKAANEMRNRVEKLLGSQVGTTLCTIHSLCVRILRQHITALNYPTSFIIMDEDDQKAVLKDIYKELNLSTKEYSYHLALSMISHWKMSDISYEEAISEAFSPIEINLARIYRDYVTYQEAHYALDFDDLILFAVRLLNEHPDIRDYWSNRFEYIHVDEFQDVSDKDFELVELLTGPNTTVCVVGDPDQTIYSFRGANIRYIMDFEKHFKGATTFYLTKNYRSTTNILEASNLLIANNEDRLEKNLESTHEDGAKIIHYSAFDDEGEAEYVAETIEDVISTVDGVNYSDFAILYRANYLSRHIEQKLIQSQIPYRIYGGLKFFSRKEVKDFLSYLRLVNNGDDLSFERVINVPSRKIGEKTVDKIKNYARMYNMSCFDAVAFCLKEIGIGGQVALRIHQFVNVILKARELESPLEVFAFLEKETGYIEMLRQSDEEDRINNVYELKNAMVAYFERHEGEPSLQDFLQEVALFTSQDNDENGEFVSLMTIHMAKGLEFPYLFVIGLSEDVFPSKRSIEEGGKAGLEEERRLAYVAFTRAEKQLYLVENNGYNYIVGGNKVKSRFVEELGNHFVEHLGRTNRYEEDAFVHAANLHTQSKQRITLTDDTFKSGDIVSHDVFGRGVVLSVKNGLVEVAFPMPYGVKTLMEGHPALKKV